MSDRLALVVLAAGVGSRYGGMKQLAEVGPGGHALMDYAIYDAVRAGFERVVVVVSDRTREAVQEHVDAGWAGSADVQLATQDSGDRRKPWGTGHAILSARPFVDRPFGVVNADDFYGRRSFEILSEGLAEPDSAHVLVGYRLGDTLSTVGGVSRGLCLVDGDRLRSVVELHDVRAAGDGLACREPEWSPLTGDEIASTNLWGFRAGFFESLATDFEAFRAQAGSDPDAEFLIGTAVNLEIERGPGVRVMKTPDPFFGVTFQDDRPGVQDQSRAASPVGSTRSASGHDGPRGVASAPHDVLLRYHLSKRVVRPRRSQLARAAMGQELRHWRTVGDSRRRHRPGMKLAEALALQAGAQKRLERSPSARYQEGEDLPEDANALVAEAEGVVGELEDLNRRRNRTDRRHRPPGWVAGAPGTGGRRR